jgi:hypothetical protein
MTRKKSLSLALLNVEIKIHPMLRPDFALTGDKEQEVMPVFLMRRFYTNVLPSYEDDPKYAESCLDRLKSQSTSLKKRDAKRDSKSPKEREGVG